MNSLHDLLSHLPLDQDNNARDQSEGSNNSNNGDFSDKSDNNSEDFYFYDEVLFGTGSAWEDASSGFIILSVRSEPRVANQKVMCHAAHLGKILHKEKCRKTGWVDLMESGVDGRFLD